MYLRDIVEESFVLVQADWQVGKARGLIEALNPTHVVVHRTDPRDSKDYYYLFTKEEALCKLGTWPSQETCDEAFGLHEYQVVDRLDSYADVETAKDQGIVMENGQVIGFFDFTVPPVGVRTRKAATREVAPGMSGWDLPGPMPPGFIYRDLIADFPKQVCIDETASLLVSLSDLVDTTSGIRLPPLTSGSKVDVIVQPKRGFEVRGKSEDSLVISKKGILQFKLKATDIGQGKVLVLAFHQGHQLGIIHLAPTVVAAMGNESVQRRSSELPLALASSHQPDLMLLIFEHQINDEPALTFRLTAQDPKLGLNLKRYEPVRLHMDPVQYFQDFFKDIEDLPLNTPKDMAKVKQRLATKGSTLFETVIPPELQAKLWELRDRIRCIQVQSEEPWIPWELCKLQGRENGRVVEGPFLCEAFEITRWLPEIGFKPTLTLKKMGLVVPKDSGLPFAANERDYIKSLANGGRKVESIPATFLELTSALAEGEYDAWHFSGHGAFRTPDPNRSVILLEDNEKLTPEDLSGKVGNLGLTSPLIFLNACQIGRSAMSLTDIGGWAAKFLRAGAGVFIGSYWSVYDQAAYEFAREFYDQLLSGVPVGRAAQEARLSIRPLGDPTWLAYTVFADPLATMI